MAKNDRSSYVKMKGHPGYFQNSVSLRIRYIKVHNGVTIRFATKKTMITDAKREVDRHLTEMFSLNPKKELHKKRGILSPSITTVWKELLDERGVTRHAHTMEGYDVSWRISIEPFWGKKTVADLNAPMMRNYEKWYLQEFPTRVFFNTHKHLSMLVRFCHLNGYIEKPVVVTELDLVIEARTQKEKVGRVYTEKEFQACIADAFSPMVKVGLLCYRYMGMRKNELLTAQRKHWDLKSGTAKLWSAKNGKWRTIVIPDVVRPTLQEWVRTLPASPYLFPAPKDASKCVSSQVFDDHWLKTKLSAQISGAEVANAARIHDWRHTFATQTAVDGWPPIVACYVLDMSLKEYQDTYTHVSIADIMSLMAKSFRGLK